MAQVEKPDAQIRTTQGEGLLDRLGNPHSLCPLGVALDEVSQLGEAQHEQGAGGHREWAGIAEVLVKPLADEGLNILPMEVDRLQIVAQAVVITNGVSRLHTT